MKTMSTSRFTFVQMEEKHLEAIQSLIKTVFRKHLDLNFLKNKYFDTLGIGPIATVAFEGNKIIGFYGAIAQEFLWKNSKIKVAHACDSFTLQSHQGQGIHFQLAHLSYELMKKQNIKFVYAFHSENTYESTKKLDWKVMSQMARFHSFTGSFPSAKILKKLHLSSRTQKKAKKVLAEYSKRNFDQLSLNAHQKWDDVFFNYKNQLFPHYIIELEECIFYLKIDSMMHIGFFTFPNQQQLKLAIAKLNNIAKKLGVNEILFQCSENSMMYSGLVKEMNPQSSWKIGYLLFDEIAIEEFEFTYANLDTF